MLDFLPLDLELVELVVGGLVIVREVVLGCVGVGGGCRNLASMRSVLQASQQR